MARKRCALLTEKQWAKIEPLLPPLPEHPKGGRPWCDDRRVLEGILWILRTGARWRDLPPPERAASCLDECGVFAPLSYLGSQLSVECLLGGLALWAPEGRLNGALGNLAIVERMAGGLEHLLCGVFAGHEGTPTLALARSSQIVSSGC